MSSQSTRTASQLKRSVSRSLAITPRASSLRSHRSKDLRRVSQTQAALRPAERRPSDAKQGASDGDGEDDLLDGLIEEGEDEESEKESDDVDGLLDDLTDEGEGASTASKTQSREELTATVTAYQKAVAMCETKLEAYAKAQAPMSGGESSFRAIQGAMMWLKEFGDKLTRPRSCCSSRLWSDHDARRHHIAFSETRG